jgi:hypothetical protein
MNPQTILEARLQEQQQRWQRLSAKLSALIEQRDLETRAEEKLRLDALIATTEQERQAVEQQMEALQAQARLPSGPSLAPAQPPAGGQPLQLFYSYSHKDEALRERLEVSLALLKRQGIIQTWHDRQIGAGDEWASQISEHLENADIILLLVSADFIASDYCWDIELSRALQRHEQGQAWVIPILLREADWHSAPFGKLQALPKDAKPIKRWADEDAAFADVAQGIRKAAQALIRKRQA